MVLVIFYLRSGVFRTGMLSKVLDDLKKIGAVNPELEYVPPQILQRTPNDWNLENFNYYDYQEELYS